MIKVSRNEFEKLIRIPEFIESLKNYPPIIAPLSLFQKEKKEYFLNRAFENFNEFLSKDSDSSFQKKIRLETHLKLLNRRRFLKQAAVLGAGALGAGVFGWEMVFLPDQKEVKKNLQNVLKEFILGSVNPSLSKEDIKEMLYTVFYRGDEPINFSALYLGDGIFLTVNHYNAVLKRKGIPIESLRLTKQTSKGNIFSHETFREIHSDEKKDLSLLYAPKMKLEGKAIVQLSNSPIKEHEECSTLRIVEAHEPQVFELIGKEYFEGERSLRLGKEIFHKKAWYTSNQFYEKQGFVLPYALIKRLYQRFPKAATIYDPSHLFLCTLLSEGGESGSPVFRKLGEDNFQLIGILHGAWDEKNGVPRANHPYNRGYKGVKQGGNISINNGAIREFIVECIKKLN